MQQCNEQLDSKSFLCWIGRIKIVKICQDRQRERREGESNITFADLGASRARITRRYSHRTIIPSVLCHLEVSFRSCCRERSVHSTQRSRPKQINTFLTVSTFICLPVFLTMNKLMPLKKGLDAPNIRRIEVVLMQPLRDEVLLNRPSALSWERLSNAEAPPWHSRDVYFVGRATTTHSSPPSDKSNVRTLWRVTKLACLEK